MKKIIILIITIAFISTLSPALAEEKTNFTQGGQDTWFLVIFGEDGKMIDKALNNDETEIKIMPGGIIAMQWPYKSSVAKMIYSHYKPSFANKEVNWLIKVSEINLLGQESVYIQVRGQLVLNKITKKITDKLDFGDAVVIISTPFEAKYDKKGTIIKIKLKDVEENGLATFVISLLN